MQCSFSVVVVVHMLPIYIHVFFFGLLFICCIYMHDFIIFLGGIPTMFARLLMILHFFLEHANYVCKVADDFAFF